MSYNGAGVFDINTAGQPVVAGTLIDETVFNNLTADIGTGLSTAITKDGQTTVTANIPMSGFRITELGLGTATTDAARVDNVNAHVCEFRLTLTTGVPVTTADVLAAETLYCSPFKGNSIALYNGSAWVMRFSAEISIDVPDVTGLHDVFCYDNAGTPTLEVLVWTNDTTRATGLVYQNGVPVKSGDATRRYLGTFYSTTAGNGQIEDSFANRYLWNYYNRCKRQGRVLGSGTWAYTTATIRQANASSANQVNFVWGVNEDFVSAKVVVMASNASAATIVAGVGIDTTTAFSGLYGATSTAGDILHIGHYEGLVAAGRHFLSWNESSSAVGTTTWYGSSGTLYQGGLYVELNG